ncbi:MAG: glycosyltransferase [Paludibacteraceae bacterium]
MFSPYKGKSKCVAVIPSIDGLYLLRRLLPTIDLPKDHIIVVDQGSLDGTEDFCLQNGYKVLQLKKRSTFTRAVNLGMKEALKQNADYILVINNDTEFKTSIASQLVSRMEQEENLGIAAPRQIIVDNDKEVLSITRVFWNLKDITFNHDIGALSSFPEILDSDFCEFTCVLISKALITKIGMLDERYEFYHEDADFAFRAQLAGFRCAYDQLAVIRHYMSSTVSKLKSFNKEAIISRNKNYFLMDYMGPQICINNVTSPEISSWSVTNEKLYTYLNKYGLVSQNDSNRSLSTLAHPEMVNTDYLLTVWETTKLPKKWVKNLYKFKHIFVPSQWNADVLKSSGFSNVTVIPFGVDTDTFNPWGDKLNFPWDKTILSICRGQYRKALDVTEKAWGNVRDHAKGTFLALYGKDTGFSCLEDQDFEARVFGPFIANIYHELQIVHLIPSIGEYVSEKDVATLYRSVDLYLLNSRSEGFGYPVIEAMACGTLCLIPNYGSVKEFIHDGNCFSFEGTPIKADYKDKGFSEDVGDWWEPNIDDISSKIITFLSIDTKKKNLIQNKARTFITSNYTWRNTALKLRASLLEIEKTYSEILESSLSNNHLPTSPLTPEKLFSFENRLLEYLARQSQEFASYAEEIAKSLEQSRGSSSNSTLTNFLKDYTASKTYSISIDQLLNSSGKDFIDSAYLVILGRAPDDLGAKHYLSKLTSDFSKLDILYDIRNSAEGKAKAIPNKALDEILSVKNKKLSSTLLNNIWPFKK